MKVGIFHGGLQVGGWASNMLAMGNAIVTCKSVVSDQGCHWSLRTRAFKQGKLEIGDLISHVLSLLSSNDFGWFWWCLLVPNFNPQSNLCHPRQDAKSGGALLAKPVQGSLMGIRVVNSRDTEVGYPKKTSPLIAVTHPYHSQKITWDSTVPPASRLSTLDIDRPLVDYIIRWLPSHTSHLLLKWYPELNNPSQDWINRNLPLSLRGVSHHKPMNNPSKTQQKTYFSCWSSWTRHFSHIFSFFFMVQLHSFCWKYAYRVHGWPSIHHDHQHLLGGTNHDSHDTSKSQSFSEMSMYTWSGPTAAPTVRAQVACRDLGSKHTEHILYTSI